MNDYTIETDGRTMWVNAPNCVARFCPISAEIYGDPSETRAVRGTDKVTQRETWLWFAAQVAERYGINLGNKHAPEWMRTGAKVSVRGAVKEIA